MIQHRQLMEAGDGGRLAGDLSEWLGPFVALLGDRRRERMCPAYVKGLIGPGDRRSVQPLAMRALAIGYDQLDHFIGGALWDSAALEEELARHADVLVEHAQTAPANEPVLDRLVRAVTGRCIASAQSVPDHKDDAAHYPLIIDPRNAARQCEIRLYPTHLRLAQQPQLRHQ